MFPLIELAAVLIGTATKVIADHFTQNKVNEYKEQGWEAQNKGQQRADVYQRGEAIKRFLGADKLLPTLTPGSEPSQKPYKPGLSETIGAIGGDIAQFAPLIKDVAGTGAATKLAKGVAGEIGSLVGAGTDAATKAAAAAMPSWLGGAGATSVGSTLPLNLGEVLSSPKSVEWLFGGVK
jgi:hypothetical protein